MRLEFVDGEGDLLSASTARSANLAWWDGVPDGIGWGKPGRIVLTATFRAAHVRLATCSAPRESAR